MMSGCVFERFPGIFVGSKVVTTAPSTKIFPPVVDRRSTVSATKWGLPSVSNGAEEMNRYTGPGDFRLCHAALKRLGEVKSENVQRVGGVGARWQARNPYSR